MQRLWTWLRTPPVDGPGATTMIRLMAGGVFFWEGILKFVYENQGLGRFTKLGIPFPGFTAPFVGWLEIIGGLLLMLGLATRLIAVPLIIEMLWAMLSTKPRLFLGTPLWRTLVMEITPVDWRASVNAAAMLAWNVGWAVSTFFAGVLIDRSTGWVGAGFDGYTLPMLLTIGIYVVAIAVEGRVFWRHRRLGRATELAPAEEDATLTV